MDFDALVKKGEVKEGMGNAAREQYAHKVGLKKPNPAGLFDMHGNVAEWCSDWYGEKLSGGADPVGPEGGSDRVVRGGGWGSDPDNCRSANRNRYVPSYRGGCWRFVPDCCHSTYRGNIEPSGRNGPLGFRVARSQSAQ